MTSLSVPANQFHGCLSPTCTGGALSNPSHDVVVKTNMKHLNSPAGDYTPIYIFILLFAILLLSFLATTDFRPRSAKPEQ